MGGSTAVSYSLCQPAAHVQCHLSFKSHFSGAILKKGPLPQAQDSSPASPLVCESAALENSTAFLSAIQGNQADHLNYYLVGLLTSLCG